MDRNLHVIFLLIFVGGEVAHGEVNSWAEKIIPSILGIRKNIPYINSMNKLNCSGDKYEGIKRQFQEQHAEISKFEGILDVKTTELLNSLQKEYAFPKNVNEKLTKLSESLTAVEKFFSIRDCSFKQRENPVLTQKILGSLVDEKTNREETILDSMLKSFEKVQDNRCDKTVSPRQQFYSLYTSLVLAEIKAFATIVEQNVWTCLFNSGFTCRNPYNDFSHWNETGHDLQSNLKKWRNSFEAVTHKAPNSIRRCDSSVQKHGVSYAEVAGLTYAFIANKTDFEDGNHKIYCSTQCSSISRSSQDCPVGSSCGNSSPWRKICPGRVFDCDKEGNYQVCESEKSSTRHYEWITRSHDSDKFGDSSKACRSETKEYPQILEKQYEHVCKACMCMCENSDITLENQTIRAISFMSSEANWKNNMVAVGARLVAKDRMIHIQLREGALLPNGKIYPGSEKWIPLPNFEYKNNFPHLQVYPNGTRRILRENIDYGLINLEKNRINLDDLSAPSGHVIIGARFADYKLNIFHAQFNFETGTVSSGNIVGKNEAPEFQKFYLKQRRPLILNKPDNSLKLKESFPDSEANQFVTIGKSDILKDASQSVIPFFDLLEISTKPSAPLGAIGIFHKGSKDLTSGGYISLRIYPITN